MDAREAVRLVGRGGVCVASSYGSIGGRLGWGCCGGGWMALVGVGKREGGEGSSMLTAVKFED